MSANQGKNSQNCGGDSAQILIISSQGFDQNGDNHNEAPANSIVLKRPEKKKSKAIHIEGLSELEKEMSDKEKQFNNYIEQCKYDLEHEKSQELSEIREMLHQSKIEEIKNWEERINHNDRVYVCKLFITYPQCDISLDVIANHLKKTKNYEGCIIAREEHQKTHGWHYHCYYKCKNYRDRYDKIVKSFDITYNDHHYHPNIKFIGKNINNDKRVINYLMKEDKSPYIDGINVERLMGTDLKHQKAMKKRFSKEILEISPKKAIMDGLISPIQLPNLIRAQAVWKLLVPPKQTLDTKGIWIHGRPGCGKSTLAKAWCLDHGGFYLKAQNKWWDGYMGERNVILEDLDTPALNHYLKIWADKWGCSGEIKGATVNLQHETFIVTSNYSIEEIVSMGKDENSNLALLQAIARRFKIITLQDDEQFFTYNGEHYYIDNNGEIREKEAPIEPDLNANDNNKEEEEFSEADILPNLDD